ncbi:MAG: hydantoinase/oxoprolinase family protein [SAR324 cluster bacterium]|nr:hydantoinase/oxoprolinase family protein [SAR324 cluster bacterium]
MLWVGVDVGGTFTDGVLYDESAAAFRYAKAPSTPSDPVQGVLDVLFLLEVDLAAVERLVHGVTLGTNAILERKGAEVWMLTTQGFRDVLEIARTNRPVLYDIKSLKTPPLVPRTRTLEIEERMMFDGSVRVPMREAQLREALAAIPAGQPGALAVCFLHSYANPAHEQAAVRLAAETLPGWFVCASCEVLPQYREYERFNTTALNAYIGPLMDGYLGGLQARLAEGGYGGKIFIMTSNGGVSSAERARKLPVHTVLSGPAGGVAAALHLGALLDIENQITCDMGGTSTDVCLVEGLHAPVSNEQYIGEYANRTPQIEINTVGAGGGSIAWLDAGDILMVGPRSAGAQPGPACYGQGGTEPTVTDANLLLGRLRPGGRLGGALALDEALALKAIAKLGKRIPSLETEQLAEGIIRIAVARMVSAIKQISIGKGFDPRDFILNAYGGAGPMHAAWIAEELEMLRVLVPLAPGNFAAFGSLISDIRQDAVRTRAMQPRTVNFAEIENLFREMEDQGRARLREEGVPPRAIHTLRSLGMRYLGQSWELDVDLPASIQSVEALEAAFSEVHERRFGHRSAEATEIVSFKLASVGRVPKPARPPWPGKGKLDTARLTGKDGTRQVYFSGKFHSTAVYERELLPRGAGVTGPAIVEENGATTVVPPGWRAAVLEQGDLMLERAAP